MVFLIETKLMIKNASFLKQKLGFVNLFGVDYRGRNGGLILLWKAIVQVEIQSYSNRHINVMVKTSSNGQEWKFTSFYGNPEVTKRKESWALLRHLSYF